jgi:hydroxymethylpyrimidine/phosphomethylpyrimidine kinase
MIVLAIGGLDPSGGAGILQDARTLSDLGGRAMAVATAWTAQSSRGVEAWGAIAPEATGRQIGAVLADFPVRAVKVGMLGTAAHAGVIADALRGRGLPVVLDPVLAASVGGSLARPDLVEALRRILSIARVVTPNLDEAEALAGRPVRDVAAMIEAGRRLVGDGAAAALIKGGHLAEPRDVLVDTDGVLELSGPRVSEGPVHGTGCVLASALAFFLASGMTARQAAALARDHLLRRLAQAERLGGGPLAYP